MGSIIVIFLIVFMVFILIIIKLFNGRGWIIWNGMESCILGYF